MKERLQDQGDIDPVGEAHRKSLEASAKASALAGELFQEGSGYGDPEARANDEHRLQTARLDAERLHCEYSDLEHRGLESKMLKLQQSQRRDVVLICGGRRRWIGDHSEDPRRSPEVVVVGRISRPPNMPLQIW